MLLLWGSATSTQPSPIAGLDLPARIGEEGSELGARINAYGDSQPVMKQYADQIPPYNPKWGAAASSILSQCQSCCMYQATCNAQDCAKAGIEDFSICKSDFPLEILLGPPPRNWPDIELEDNGFEAAYIPSQPNGGEEWFVVGFPQPVHATAVEIAELSGPGAVVKISVASEYAGNKTNWVPIWSGPTQDVPDQPRTFSPAICPAFGTMTRFVRVDIRTDLVEGYQKFVAVTLLGTTDDGNDWVLSSDGSLLYVPTPGVEILEGADLDDSFAAVVMDCSTEAAEPAPVFLPDSMRKAALKASAASFFGAEQEVLSIAGSMDEVVIDISGPVKHLSAALGRDVAAEEFEVKLMSSACFLIADVDSHKVLNAPDTSLNSTQCSQLDKSGPMQPAIPLSSSLNFLIKAVDQGVLHHNLTATATAYNVSYTLRLSVEVHCQPEASIYDCANSPEDCEEGSQFDFSLRSCIAVVLQEPAVVSLTVIMVIAICSLLAILAIGAGVFVIHSRTKAGLSGGSSKPPGEGDPITVVITGLLPITHWPRSICR
eukprot:scaffold261363_cov42-Prasinocladus_malaysianus.AAC.1